MKKTFRGLLMLLLSSFSENNFKIDLHMQCCNVMNIFDKMIRPILDSSFFTHVQIILFISTFVHIYVYHHYRSNEIKMYIYVIPHMNINSCNIVYMFEGKRAGQGRC